MFTVATHRLTGDLNRPEAITDVILSLAAKRDSSRRNPIPLGVSLSKFDRRLQVAKIASLSDERVTEPQAFPSTSAAGHCTGGLAV
jgi:hypothetical protein